MARKTKTSGTPLYLLLTEDRTGEYYHLYGRVVTQRYEQSSWQPDGVDDSYSDGLLYSGLQLRCQGDEDSRRRAINAERDAPVYGFDCEYRDVFHVNRRIATRMAKTLTTLEAKLNKLADRRGYVGTYGAYVGRVAEALGCVGIGFARTARSRDVTGERWQWGTIGDGVSRIDRLIDAWVDEARPAPAAAGESAASCSQPEADLNPDAPPVPAGKRPRAGVEYGCGRADCTDCYEPDAMTEVR